MTKERGGHSQGDPGAPLGLRAATLAAAGVWFALTVIWLGLGLLIAVVGLISGQPVPPTEIGSLVVGLCLFTAVIMIVVTTGMVVYERFRPPRRPRPNVREQELAAKLDHVAWRAVRRDARRRVRRWAIRRVLALPFVPVGGFVAPFLILEVPMSIIGLSTAIPITAGLVGAGVLITIHLRTLVVTLRSPILVLAGSVSVDAEEYEEKTVAYTFGLLRPIHIEVAEAWEISASGELIHRSSFRGSRRVGVAREGKKWLARDSSGVLVSAGVERSFGRLVSFPDALSQAQGD
jgi:hypothetical protein